MLSPDHYRRRVTRPVSYYALFKWWLLLSQHPGCRSNPTSLVTWHGLGTLAGGLGCSPFEREHYRPRSYSRGRRDGIQSLVEGCSRVGPTFHPVLYPHHAALEASPKAISERTRYP